MPVSESKTFTYEGRRIVYDEQGCGGGVLLLHGHTCTREDWRNQFDPLSRRFHVLAPDVPFYGESDPGPLPFDRQWVGRALWALCDHAGMGRIVPVGHSLGAKLCKIMYLSRPEQVRGLVTVDSAVGAKLNATDSAAPQRIPPEEERGIEERRAILERIGHPTVYPSSTNVTLMQRLCVASKVFAARFGPRPPTALPEGTWCNVPMLAFVAGHGRYGQEAINEEWVKKNVPTSAAARVIVARNSGHWAMIEEAELVTRELLAFLESLAWDES